MNRSAPKAEAARLSRATYFTGKPCKHGHFSERETRSSKCLECLRLSLVSRERARLRKLCSTAKSQGLKRYFSGVACKNGHVCERYTANRVCVECQRQQDPKRTAAYGKRYLSVAANLEKKRISGLKWRHANPQKVNERARRYHAKRKSLKLSAKGSFSSDDIRKIYKLQKGRCAYCRKSLKEGFEIDHITPLSRGGTNYPRNIQLLCRLACNQSKRNRDPVDFARSRGLLI